MQCSTNPNTQDVCGTENLKKLFKNIDVPFPVSNKDIHTAKTMFKRVF
jgi:hypothetical protein